MLTNMYFAILQRDMWKLQIDNGKIVFYNEHGIDKKKF